MRSCFIVSLSLTLTPCNQLLDHYFGNEVIVSRIIIINDHNDEHNNSNDIERRDTKELMEDWKEWISGRHNAIERRRERDGKAISLSSFSLPLSLFS